MLDRINDNNNDDDNNDGDEISIHRQKNKRSSNNSNRSSGGVGGSSSLRSSLTQSAGGGGLVSPSTSPVRLSLPLPAYREGDVSISAARVASLSGGGGGGGGRTGHASAGGGSPGAYLRAGSEDGDQIEGSLSRAAFLAQPVTSGFRKLFDMGRGLIGTTTAGSGTNMSSSSSIVLDSGGISSSSSGGLGTIISRSSSLRSSLSRDRGDSSSDTQPILEH